VTEERARHAPSFHEPVTAPHVLPGGERGHRHTVMMIRRAATSASLPHTLRSTEHWIRVSLYDGAALHGATRVTQWV
jgi:hypothetical protein